MTLEQLRIFVAVAEREHVTRAAEALRLTQSAVSAAVASLENRYATQLFHRVGRGIVLTEAGRLFLREAKAVLARAEDAEAVLNELAELKRGRLSIQASQTIASYWLPRHVVRFRRTWPDIAIGFGMGNTAQVARAVLDGTVDLGFIEGPVDDPALLQEPLIEDRLILVIAEDHPWRLSPPQEPKQLAEVEWVLREPGSGTRSEFEAALGALNVPRPLKVALEMPSNEAVCEAVESGAGAAGISELVAAARIQSGRLFKVPFELPSGRQFQTIRHRERHLSKAADTFLKAIAQA